jgi:serralysin
MLTTTSVARSGRQDIDGLLYSLKFVNTNFTFSFPTSASLYQPNSAPLGELTNNFEALTAVQQAGVRAALAQFSAVTNLTFTEITETTTQHANMRFAETDATSTAWAYLPKSGGSNADVWFSHGDACSCTDCAAEFRADDGSSPVEKGDAWFNNSRNYFENPVKGGYGFHTFVHEIGHTLGLVHGHATGNVFGPLPGQHDSLEYSVMTYRTFVGSATSGYTYETWGAPQGLMQNDIAALQSTAPITVTMAAIPSIAGTPTPDSNSSTAWGRALPVPIASS